MKNVAWLKWGGTGICAVGHIADQFEPLSAQYSGARHRLAGLDAGRYHHQRSRADG